jgi:adenine phosphoribosyltransferase
MDLKACIREIPDFPKKGILFYDITTLLANPKAFTYSIDALADRVSDLRPDKILAAEARGFLFGAALSYKLGVGFIPVRKHGKLPYTTVSATYDLEYGTDTLHMHVDALDKGESILIVDDVLATGGTAAGMVKLVESCGGTVCGLGFILELLFLNGAAKLSGHRVESLLTY